MSSRDRSSSQSAKFSTSSPKTKKKKNTKATAKKKNTKSPSRSESKSESQSPRQFSTNNVNIDDEIYRKSLPSHAYNHGNKNKSPDSNVEIQSESDDSTDNSVESDDNIKPVHTKKHVPQWQKDRDFQEVKDQHQDLVLKEIELQNLQELQKSQTQSNFLDPETNQPLAKHLIPPPPWAPPPPSDVELSLSRALHHAAKSSGSREYHELAGGEHHDYHHDQMIQRLQVDCVRPNPLFPLHPNVLHSEEWKNGASRIILGHHHRKKKNYKYSSYFGLNIGQSQERESGFGDDNDGDDGDIDDDYDDKAEEGMHLIAGFHHDIEKLHHEHLGPRASKYLREHYEQVNREKQLEQQNYQNQEWQQSDDINQSQNNNDLNFRQAVATNAGNTSMGRESGEDRESQQQQEYINQQSRGSSLLIDGLAWGGGGGQQASRSSSQLMRFSDNNLLTKQQQNQNTITAKISSYLRKTKRVIDHYNEWTCRPHAHCYRNTHRLSMACTEMMNYDIWADMNPGAGDYEWLDYASMYDPKKTFPRWLDYASMYDPTKTEAANHHSKSLPIVTVGFPIAQIVNFVMYAQATGRPYDGSKGVLGAEHLHFKPWEGLCYGGIRGGHAGCPVVRADNRWSDSPPAVFKTAVTYGMVHAHTEHILGNVVLELFLGVPLEMVHGTLRLACLCFIGLIGGAWGHGVYTPIIGLVGSSGYAYSLVGMHLANLILNWTSIDRDHVRLISFIPNNILRFFWILVFVGINIMPLLRGESLPEGVSHAAHFVGAVMGLLFGMRFLKNIKPEFMWEKHFAMGGLVVGSILLIVCGLVLTVMSDDGPNSILQSDCAGLSCCGNTHFPLTNTEAYGDASALGEPCPDFTTEAFVNSTAAYEAAQAAKLQDDDEELTTAAPELGDEDEETRIRNLRRRKLKTLLKMLNSTQDLIDYENRLQEWIEDTESYRKSNSTTVVKFGPGTSDSITQYWNQNFNPTTTKFDYDFFKDHVYDFERRVRKMTIPLWMMTKISEKGGPDFYLGGSQSLSSTDTVKSSESFSSNSEFKINVDNDDLESTSFSVSVSEIVISLFFGSLGPIVLLIGSSQ